MERPARWHTYVYPLHLERTEGCIYIGISIVGFHTDSTPPATLFQDSWVAHACWSFAPPLHPCSSAAGKPLRRSDAIITLPSSLFLCIFLHYRLRSLPERFPTFARIVSRRELPYTLLSQSRLFQGLPGPFAFPKSTFCTYLTRLPLCSSITRLSSRRILRASARWPAKSRNFSNGFFPLERRKKERVLIVVSQVCWTNTRWWGGARSKWSLIFEEIRSVFHR